MVRIYVWYILLLSIGAEISSGGHGATDCSVLCTSWATTFCPAVCLSFTACRNSGRLRIAVVCYFDNIHGAENFSRGPGAITFSSDVRLFFTQARGHHFQPSCGPVFKIRANSGPCGMLRPFFSSRPGATSFGPVMGLCHEQVQEQTRSGPCGMFRLQTVFLKNVLAFCVVPV